MITADDEYRVHTVAVEPRLDGASLDVGQIGGHTRENLARRNEVTLLWPPPEPGGYSLIVDGQAEVAESDGETVGLRVAPTRALLHRNIDSPSVAQGCLHTCVVFSLPAECEPYLRRRPSISSICPTLAKLLPHPLDDDVRPGQHFGADPHHGPAGSLQQRDSLDVP